MVEYNTKSVPVIQGNPSFVFFGKVRNLGKVCVKCDAYQVDDSRNAFCSYTLCPIALKEFKRRGIKRESFLENKTRLDKPGEVVQIRIEEEY